MPERCETRYVIVGSGVSGALLAEGLLAAGKGPVLMLEAGPPLRMRDYRMWLDMVMAGKTPYAGLSDTQADYVAQGAQPWQIPGGRLFVRGGSTVHWGGWCPRMKPEDFELRSRVGFGGLDWPWSYGQMEPFYARAERYLQVAGDSADKDPPRRTPYPFEAPTFTLVDGVIIQALDRLEISHYHIPIARNAVAINGMPQCVTTGTCNYCPLGARFTGDQPVERLVARYSSAGTFELRTGAAVRRVIPDGRRRAAAVEYVDTATGRITVVEAENVMLCAGALEVPKLMLASVAPEWPRGLGNDRDLVGRFVVANPFFYARGTAPTNSQRLQEELFIPTLGSRHWDTPQYQREGKFLMNRSPSPNLNLAGQMVQGKTTAEIEAATVGQQTLELQGTVQTFSYPENRVGIAPGNTRFGVPRTLIDTPREAYDNALMARITGRMQQVLNAIGYATSSASMGAYPQRGDHAMCTTRMSASPADGVVDTQFRVHGMDNVYILSNSVFPSGAAANPTLTLAALGFRLLGQLGAGI